MEEQNYIRMSNNWFNGDDNLSLQYGEKGFVLLARMMQRQSIRGYDLTDRHIQAWFGYADRSHRSIKSVFGVLNMFKQNGIVKFCKDYDFTKICTDIVEFTPTDISLPPNKFFILFDDEIDTILNSNNQNVNRHKLFLLFGCLKYHYNTGTKYCYPTIESLSDKTRLSTTTILSYIDVLVDLGLILYDNPGTKLYPDGTVKECNNYYTMNSMSYPGNKEVLDQLIIHAKQELQQQEESNQLKIVNNTIGNKKRSIRTKMYHLGNRLDKGKVTQEEFQLQYTALQVEYDKLLAQQKSIHDR